MVFLAILVQNAYLPRPERKRDSGSLQTSESEADESLGWWQRNPSWTPRVNRAVFVTIVVEHVLVKTATADVDNPVWNQDFTFQLKGHKVSALQSQTHS